MNKKITLAALFFLSVFALSAQEARYGIKSAIIKKTTEAMGLKTEMTQYIDDYGVKEALITEYRHIITKDNARITIALKNKTGTKEALSKNRSNFLKLTPEMIKENEMKEEGKEEVAGKMCDKYTMVTDLNITGKKTVTTIWIWKGIVLKRVIPSVGLTEFATEIQENVAIKPEIFIVPNDITMQEGEGTLMSPITIRQKKEDM